MNKIKLISHKGFLDLYPENSLAAIKFAWDLGITPGIDLRSTKDEQIIGFCDETLLRTTNAPTNIDEKPINNLLFDEIKEITLISDDKKKHTIPLFKEILYYLGEKIDRKIVIDCKTLSITRNIIPLIQAFNAEKQVIVASNSIEECKEIKTALPNIETLLSINMTEERIDLTYQKAVEDPFVDQILFILEKHPDKKNHFHLSYPYLEAALKKSTDKQCPLILYHREFQKKSFKTLLALGFTDFATDNVEKFLNLII